MSCEEIKMQDGTTLLANVRPGAKLTEQDKQILAEYVQFCRERRAKRGLRKVTTKDDRNHGRRPAR